MVSHHPAKFGGHRHCGCGVFLVAEEQDSTCSRLNPTLLTNSKIHGLKAHGLSYS